MLTFSQALEFLKQGVKMQRAGWNGKGMYLLLVNANEFSIHFNAEQSKGFGDTVPELLPWIGMKTADGKFVPWLASQTDILAADWQTAG